jgi:hypothetical protein
MRKNKREMPMQEFALIDIPSIHGTNAKCREICTISNGVGVRHSVASKSILERSYLALTISKK